LDGPWFQVSGATHYRDWDKYHVPRQLRHGGMLSISFAEYDALVKAFGNATNAEKQEVSSAP
jgi:hypothetical protein